jgi:GT2 family glycosyltransferase
MYAVFRSPLHSLRPDFAQIISRTFEHGRFLIIGASEELQRQFTALGREAVSCESYPDLERKLNRDYGGADFQIAVLFYSGMDKNDDRIAEELSRCSSEIVLIPGADADATKRRSQLVESFRRIGFLPDYMFDLIEIDPGAIRLRRQRSEIADELVPAAETAFARLHKRLDDLQRALRARMTELEAAHHHIATVEEKLLKLKQYRRELKLLKEQRQALRKSPERRVGQLLLAPYRLPEKLVKTVWKKLHPRAAKRRQDLTEYQRWFERHRANMNDLDRMRHERRSFRLSPRISIITPVFNTPVPRLEEAIESVLAQVYEDWELLLIDDGSTAADLLRALPALATRDRRIHLLTLGSHQGIGAASNRGLAGACGEWIVFLDHDDVLEPDALFQVVKLLQTHPNADLIYSDEDKLSENGFEAPLFKPDWSPDFFLSYNYVGHLTAVRREIIQKISGFRSEFDSAQDYDLFLRVIERTNRIHHIPRVLYHWRRSESSSAISVRQKPGQLDASRRAIEDHLKRRSERAHVAVDWRTHAFYVRRELLEAKKVSIIMNGGCKTERLVQCIENLIARTNYSSYEIVVGGQKSQSFPNTQFRVVYGSVKSGAAALSNFAVQQTNGPWLLFLDAGIEPIETDWLTIMAEHIQRPEVGAVGPRLVNFNGTIEHAGIILGVNGVRQPAFRGFPAEHPGVNRQLQISRNCSAVSGACLLTRREIFLEVGGFDEDLPESLADVDLCLKLRQAGYLIVYSPFAKLYWDPAHYEKIDTSVDAIMRQRWSDVLERDPYYNPNFSRECADFSLGKSKTFFGVK